METNIVNDRWETILVSTAINCLKIFLRTPHVRHRKLITASAGEVEQALIARSQKLWFLVLQAMHRNASSFIGNENTFSLFRTMWMLQLLPPAQITRGNNGMVMPRGYMGEEKI